MLKVTRLITKKYTHSELRIFLSECAKRINA